MKKLLISAASAVAVLGLAACSDTDDTTTQSVEPEAQEQAPEATPTEPQDDAGATDSMGTDDEQTSQ